MADGALTFNIDDLPVDVFELTASGVEVETLTAGHGMTEYGASLSTSVGSGWASCGCSGGSPYEPH